MFVVEREFDAATTAHAEEFPVLSPTSRRARPSAAPIGSFNSAQPLSMLPCGEPLPPLLRLILLMLNDAPSVSLLKADSDDDDLRDDGASKLRRRCGPLRGSEPVVVVVVAREGDCCGGDCCCCCCKGGERFKAETIALSCSLRWLCQPVPPHSASNEACKHNDSNGLLLGLSVIERRSLPCCCCSCCTA